MSNFGNIGGVGFVLIVLVWCIPFLLIVWFIKTLTGMASSLREIATRIEALERAVRDAVVGSSSRSL